MARRLTQLVVLLAVTAPMMVATLPFGAPMVICIDAHGHLALERPHAGGHECDPDGAGHVSASGDRFQSKDGACLDFPIEPVGGAREPSARASLDTKPSVALAARLENVEWVHNTPWPPLKAHPVLQKPIVLRALSTVVLLL